MPSPNASAATAGSSSAASSRTGAPRGPASRGRRRSAPPATWRCRSTPSARPAFPTSTRSRATSKTCRGSTSPTAPARSVHPAPWYVGLRPSGLLPRAEERARHRDRRRRPRWRAPCAGVPVEVTLTQVQWTSVRRAEGNGFYTWDTERREVPAGSWTITTGEAPVPLTIPFDSGGYFTLEARGRGENGRSAVTRTSLLRARRGLHGLGPLRSQPHRPGAREADLPAGRDGAHHDPVAVGTGDGARHDRARGHPLPSPLRADLHAAVDCGADRRRRHPERVRVGAARQGPHQSPRRQPSATATSAATAPIPAIRASRRSASATSSSRWKTAPSASP